MKLLEFYTANSNISMGGRWEDSINRAELSKEKPLICSAFLIGVENKSTCFLERAYEIMSIYCSLRKEDIPPIGCRTFDLNYCHIEMRCPFIREVSDENKQKYENIQEPGQKIDNPDNTSRMFFFKESSWRDIVNTKYYILNLLAL